MADYSGEVFKDRYKVEEKLSEELLGWVYRGRDLESQEPVQIKVLHEHIATDEKRFARFLREVRATSMVRHINTIELLDSGSQQGVHWIVMEDFPARSLEEELRESPRLPVERVAQIAAQIAAAIGVAHQESITHRALSPRNVLLLTNVTRGDFVKVRDFGLSKLEDFDTSDEASHLTEAGVRVGNTAYMAPEYIENSRYHPKGDVYALGCLMTTMLTSEPPYTGRAADILGDHVTAPVPRPSDTCELPRWMDLLVIEMLAKQPSDRPGAYQIVARLEEGMGRKLGPPAIVGDDPEPVAPVSTGVPVGTIAAIGAGMLVIGLAFGALATVAILLVLSWNLSAPSVPSAPPAPASFQVEGPTPPAPQPEPVPEPPPVAPVVPVAKPVPTPPQVTEVQRKGTRIRVTTNKRSLVFLNGQPKGMSPIEFDVPPGDHRLVVALPGQPETQQEKKIQVKKDESFTVRFTF